MRMRIPRFPSLFSEQQQQRQKWIQDFQGFAWHPLCMSSNRWIGKIPGTGCMHILFAYTNMAQPKIYKILFSTFLATLWITSRWDVVKILWFKASSSGWKSGAANTECTSDRKFSGNTQSSYTSSNLLLKSEWESQLFNLFFVAFLRPNFVHHFDGYLASNTRVFACSQISGFFLLREMYNNASQPYGYSHISNKNPIWIPKENSTQ